LLLKRVLDAQLGRVGAGVSPLMRMLAAALVAAAAGYFANRALPDPGPVLAAAIAAAVFGAVYLAAAAAFGLEQARAVAAALLRRARRR
jgi:hypothetical protein